MRRSTRIWVVIAAWLVLAIGITAAVQSAEAHPSTAPSTSVKHQRTAEQRAERKAPRVPSVVGLGDSVMAGSACTCSGPVAEYASAIGRRVSRKIRPINLGVNGATTSSLLADLDDPAVRREIGAANAVLVIIGANDLYPQLRAWRHGGCPPSCYQPAVVKMRRRLDRILDGVDGLRPAARSRTVLVAGYWNVFTDGDVARAQGGQGQITWSRQMTRAVNRAICRSAANANATCVDTYTPFVGKGSDPTDLLASDGDHPNARGVAVLVRQLVAATPSHTFSRVG